MQARLLEEKDAKVVIIGIGIQKRHVPELQAIASGKDNLVQFPKYLDYVKAVEDEAKRKYEPTQHFTPMTNFFPTTIAIFIKNCQACTKIENAQAVDELD